MDGRTAWTQCVTATYVQRKAGQGKKMGRRRQGTRWDKPGWRDAGECRVRPIRTSGEKSMLFRMRTQLLHGHSENIGAFLMKDKNVYTYTFREISIILKKSDWSYECYQWRPVSLLTQLRLGRTLNIGFAWLIEEKSYSLRFFFYVVLWNNSVI